MVATIINPLIIKIGFIIDATKIVIIFKLFKKSQKKWQKSQIGLVWTNKNPNPLWAGE